MRSILIPCPTSRIAPRRGWENSGVIPRLFTWGSAKVWSTVPSSNQSLAEAVAFLNESMAAKRWIPLGVSVAEGVADYSNLAGRMGVGEQEAERAVGLFNGYCARCHTAGYAAGVATQQHEGSGAWAPALAGGRSVTQFPDADDQVAFIIRGSDFGVNYGLNGLGSGRMPGFGQILSLEDIELLVAYERSL